MLALSVERAKLRLASALTLTTREAFPLTTLPASLLTTTL